MTDLIGAPAPRPSWLDEPCPTWCAGLHDEAEQPADRRHASYHPTVPVIRIDDRDTDQQTPRRFVAADEFELVRHRQVGDAEEWVYLGDGEGSGQRLEITIESARRLARALQTLTTAA